MGKAKAKAKRTHLIIRRSSVSTASRGIRIATSRQPRRRDAAEKELHLQRRTAARRSTNHHRVPRENLNGKIMGRKAQSKIDTHGSPLNERDLLFCTTDTKCTCSFVQMYIPNSLWHIHKNAQRDGHVGKTILTCFTTPWRRPACGCVDGSALLTMFAVVYYGMTGCFLQTKDEIPQSFRMRMRKLKVVFLRGPGWVLLRNSCDCILRKKFCKRGKGRGRPHQIFDWLYYAVPMTSHGGFAARVLESEISL